MRAFLARSEMYQSRSQSKCAIHLFCREDCENAVVYKGIIGSTNWLLKIPQPQTALEIADSVEFLVRCPNVNRYWRAPDGEFGASFNSSGQAFLHSNDKASSVDIVRFQAAENQREMEDFALWNQSTFLEFCHRLYADERSTLRYALKWRGLNEAEKDATAFGCSNGDWAMLCHAISLAQKIATYKHGIFPLNRRSQSKSKVDSVLFRRDWTCPPKGSAACILFGTYGSMICDIVKPSFWFDEPLCHRDWRANSPKSQRYLLEICCTMPTAHEFLEAQLELRAFLRPHLTADEIEALMRPE